MKRNLIAAVGMSIIIASSASAATVEHFEQVGDYVHADWQYSDDCGYTTAELVAGYIKTPNGSSWGPYTWLDIRTANYCTGKYIVANVYSPEQTTYRVTANGVASANMKGAFPISVRIYDNATGEETFKTETAAVDVQWQVQGKKDPQPTSSNWRGDYGDVTYISHATGLEPGSHCTASGTISLDGVPVVKGSADLGYFMKMQSGYINIYKNEVASGAVQQ